MNLVELIVECLRIFPEEGRKGMEEFLMNSGTHIQVREAILSSISRKGQLVDLDGNEKLFLCE